MQLLVQLRAQRGRLLVALIGLAVISGFSTPADAVASTSSAPSAARSAASVANANSATVVEGPQSIQAVAESTASAQLTAVASQVLTAATQVSYQAMASTGICPISRGAGRFIYGDFVGMYMCGGRAVQCNDPLKPTASPAGIVETSTVYYPNSSTSKLTQAEVAKFNDVLDTYGTRLNVGGVSYGNNDLGAAVRLAGWKFGHQTSRLYRDLPYASAAVKGWYNTIVAHAEAFAGQYTLTKVSQTNPDLSGTGYVTYRVTSVTTGKTIKGFTVKASVTSGNATVSSSASDAAGILKVSFKRTKWGAINGNVVGYSQSAKVTFLPPLLSTYQRFFRAASRTAVKASFSSNVAPKVVTIDYKCTGCITAAPVTPTAPICNTYNGAETRAYLEDNGVVRSDYTVIAAGTCATPTWKVADTHKVRVRVSALVNGAWVHYYSGYVTVDCKPAPELAFASSTKCTGRVVDINVPADATHTIGLEINGSLITSPAGMPLSYHKAAPCTESLSFAIRAGITSHNGTQWNMTPLETHSFTAKSVS